MPLTDVQYLNVYITVTSACFAIAIKCTFEAIGFLMDRQARLQILCFICCVCGTINCGLTLFFTIFPSGFCWWFRIGGSFYEASLISTTFIMVFRANAVIPMVSSTVRLLFWIFSIVMITAQISIGLVITITTESTALMNDACSPLLSSQVMAGWYGSIILPAIVLTTIFSYSLMKANQHRKESFFRTVLISSGASAVLAGISQVTFMLLLAFSMLPPKYSLMLVKSDLTIHILITVTFVRRLMKESNSQGPITRRNRIDPGLAELEIQSNRVPFETVRPTFEIPKPSRIPTRY
ncbi:hypothetical protein INT43_001573 [Umbelopsis isabellina]|uniref:Uncharacterized protein n=1 Tax=Mortierella isabellina TaxID=91625 RepID=A0A8H7PF01_MORIS|nr:hypothetical protein INT43_001573 [Umbelopsis isabellina]